MSGVDWVAIDERKPPFYEEVLFLYKDGAVLRGVLGYVQYIEERTDPYSHTGFMVNRWKPMDCKENGLQILPTQRDERSDVKLLGRIDQVSHWSHLNLPKSTQE